MNSMPRDCQTCIISCVPREGYYRTSNCTRYWYCSIPQNSDTLALALTHMFPLHRVPLIRTLALGNSFLDHTCTPVRVLSFCGPWPCRPSPPCKRAVIPLVQCTSAPTWLAFRCSLGRLCPASPSCSRCWKILYGHEP